MRVVKDQNVLEAAKERISWLFDEFEDIYVSVSGGKDCEVVMYLALEEARKRGRNIGVYFLDQEFEWQGTIDIVRKWMKLPNVVPYWYQIPLKMYNTSSNLEPYTVIWDPSRKDTWMREMEPDSIKVPYCKSDRFHETVHSFTDYRHKVTGLKTCELKGLRADESFDRYTSLTHNVTYKGVTWGSKYQKTFSFCPIYDWKFTDVWKYIWDNKLEYNSVYDKLYQLGVPTTNMRISNLIHEFAIYETVICQEIEPATYEKLARAVEGVALTSRMGLDQFVPKELPEAFASWRDYRDYLLEHIVAPEHRQGFRDIWGNDVYPEKIYRLQAIECIQSDVTHSAHTRTRTILRNIEYSKRNTDGI